jgi:hypothetical protein
MPLPPGSSNPMYVVPRFSQHTYLISTRTADGSGWIVLGPILGTREPTGGNTSIMRGAVQISVDERVKLPLFCGVTIGSILTDQTLGATFEVAYARRLETHIDCSCTRIAADSVPVI